jgi:ketosteroid isomerase-like protein
MGLVSLGGGCGVGVFRLGPRSGLAYSDKCPIFIEPKAENADAPPGEGGASERWDMSNPGEWWGGVVLTIGSGPELAYSDKCPPLRDTEQTMSQKNVELVKRLHADFNQRDIAALLDLIDTDVEWVPVLAVLQGEAYRGHAGFRRWVEELDSDWESFEVFYDEVRDLGDRVLVFGHWRAHGRASGGESEQPGTWLYEIKAGKVVRLQAFTDRAAALAAVGLSE